MIKAAFALMLVLSVQPAREAPVAIYAPGTSSCGSWLAAREAHLTRTPGDVRFVQFESYVAGYASAYNVYAAGPPTAGAPVRNVLNMETMAQHWAILDTFCKHNPKQPFHQGVLALLNELNARAAQ